MIGPNGSGKTCLLDSLKFVSNIMFQGAGVAVAKAGGALRAYRRGEKKIHIGIEYPIGDRLYQKRRVPYVLDWRITVSEKEGDVSSLVTEAITIRALAEEPVDVFNLSLVYDASSGAADKLVIAPVGDLGIDFFSIFGDLAGGRSKSDRLRLLRKNVATRAKDHRHQADEPFLPSVSRWDDKLSELCLFFFSLNEYDIIPDIAKESSDPLPYADMLPTGENVSEVIYALQARRFERLVVPRYYDLGYLGYGRYSRKLSRLRSNTSWLADKVAERLERHELGDALENISSELSMAVSGIEGLETKIDKATGKRLVAFKAGKYDFLPEEVSDGTVKWLCTLVSLFVPVSAIYLLEEPENYLHPWMQQRLIELMRDAAVLSHTIFVLTTHSSALLNAALPEEVIVVDSTRSGTRATRAEEEGQINAMLDTSHFGLGDLWVSGAIGGVPGNE